MNGNYDRPGNPANPQRNRNPAGSWNNNSSGNWTNNNGSSNNSGGNWNNSGNSNSSGGNWNNNNNNDNVSSNSGNNIWDVNDPKRNLAESRAWVQKLLREHPEFVTPPQQTFDSEEMMGSIQKILSENIGNYVVIEFLIGTDRIHRKQGQIFHVGTSYITLYDDENANFILCDIFSVKFVYFFVPGQRPNRNFNILPNTNSSMG